MDINKVWLSGLAITDPVLVSTPGSTAFAHFVLQVNELFNTRSGEPRIKSNLIRVEAMGTTAMKVQSGVKKGGRFIVDGYLRQDETRQGAPTKVRAYAVTPDKGADQTVYQEGLRTSIEILKSSRDKDSALVALEGLVASN